MFWRQKPQDPQQKTREAIADLRRDIADELRQLAGDPSPSPMRKQMIRMKERQLKALEASLTLQEVNSFRARMDTQRPSSLALDPAAMRECVQSMARNAQSQARMREQTAMLQAMGELAEEEEEALGWEDEDGEDEEEEQEEEESPQAMLERYKAYCTPLEGEKKRQ